MSGDTRALFSDEDAALLDRWIDDACGDDMQFPAHRRAQFAAYKERLRRLRASGGGGQSFFRSAASRSGTREVVALQNALGALRWLRERDAAALAAVSREVDSVKQVLREKAVTEAASEAPPTLSCSGVAYESRRKLAERYVAEVERQRLVHGEDLAAQRARRLKLLVEDEQLQKEVHALHETENTVVTRFDEASAALAAERETLAQEQAAWQQLQQPAADVEANNEDDTSALSGLRASLTEVGDELTRAQASVSNAESAHVVRFRQARQRLKDWQDMVEAMRRACDQLYARTRIIGGVVEATAVRLEAESGLGYMKQLRRLNRLLLERSAKMLGVRQEADVDAVSHGSESGRMQLANYAELASLAAEEEAASSMSTPPGRHPSLSSTATTTMASSTLDSPRGAGGSSGSGSQNPQQRTTGVHRRKRRCQAYSLLTHLRRWESALAGETTAILTACAKGIGSADVTPSLSPVRCIQDIRDLLLVA